MAKSYVGAYWGARAESPDEAVTQIVRLLQTLASIDPLLSGWRNKGRTKKQALAAIQVSLDRDDLIERLLAGRNRRDDNGEPIEELGYSVSWWNGSENSRTAVTLSVGIGGYSPAVSNSVLLNLPDSSVASELYSAASARRILDSFIDVFNPDSAVWTDRTLTAAQLEPDEPLENGGYKLGGLVGTPAGWATYLANTQPHGFDAASLPVTASTHHLQNGTLITVGPDPAAPPISDVLEVRRAMGYEVRMPGPDTESHQGVMSAPVDGRQITAGPTERRAESASPTGTDGLREKPASDR